MLLIGLRLMPKGMLSKHTAKVAVRVGLAGVLMVASVWWIRDLFIVIPVVVGAVVYLTGIFLFRALTDEDLMVLKGLAQTALARLHRQRPKVMP
jgi:fatty acid desaturase